MVACCGDAGHTEIRPSAPIITAMTPTIFAAAGLMGPPAPTLRQILASRGIECTGAERRRRRRAARERAAAAALATPAPGALSRAPEPGARHACGEAFVAGEAGKSPPGP